jgi:hypothetical protein
MLRELDLIERFVRQCLKVLIQYNKSLMVPKQPGTRLVAHFLPTGAGFGLGAWDRMCWLVSEGPEEEKGLVDSKHRLKRAPADYCNELRYYLAQRDIQQRQKYFIESAAKRPA